MKPFFQPKINSSDDLLDYLSRLVKSGEDQCTLSADVCIEAAHVLEEDARQRTDFALKIRKMEDELEQTEEKYRSMLRFLVEMIGVDDGQKTLFKGEGPNGLSVPVKQFRGALDKDAESGLVDLSFMRLKDAVLSETRGNTRGIDRARLLGLMGQWLKLPEKKEDPEERYLRLFILCKDNYLTVLHELEQALSHAYKKKTTRLSQLIREAQTPEHFTRVHNGITALLQDYVAESANDRAQAVCFAEEISRKLLEMDRNLGDYLTAFEDLQTKNRQFNEEMSANIKALRESLTIGTSIQDLTRVIDKKINLLSGTLNRKKARDYSAEQRLKKQVEALKADMSKIRAELSRTKEHNAHLESELNTDRLTGVASRRAFENNAGREMQRFQRYRRAFSLLVFDVDRFKAINDSYGHPVGDKCLKEIVARIRPILRTTDILARTGGDEFVVIMPETVQDKAEQVAEKIRSQVNKTEFLYKRETLRISLSLGVAQALEADRDYESVFERADQALYLAKSRGRNRVGSSA